MPNEVQKEDFIREIEPLFPIFLADEAQEDSIRKLYRISRNLLIEKLANSIWLARNKIRDVLSSPGKRAEFFRDKVDQLIKDWILGEKRAIVHGRYKALMERCGKSGTIKERIDFAENDSSAFLALEALIANGLKIPSLDKLGSRVAFNRGEGADGVKRGVNLLRERSKRSAVTALTGRVLGVSVDCALIVSIDRSAPQTIFPQDVIEIMSG